MGENLCSNILYFGLPFHRLYKATFGYWRLGCHTCLHFSRVYFLPWVLERKTKKIKNNHRLNEWTGGYDYSLKISASPPSTVSAVTVIFLIVLSDGASNINFWSTPSIMERSPRAPVLRSTVNSAILSIASSLNSSSIFADYIWFCNIIVGLSMMCYKIRKLRR